MDAGWGWFAVAAAGVVHGLNPATGWPLAACWQASQAGRASTWRALLSMALGHVASVALVAGSAALGVAMRREAMIAAAAGLLAVLVASRLRRRRRAGLAAPTAHAGLALWSFSMATVQGAGLMLVPALLPLCLGSDASAAVGRVGPLGLALGMIGVHLTAMLAATGAVAVGVTALARRLRPERGCAAPRRLSFRRRPRDRCCSCCASP
jgi:hypothetical protein